MKSCTKILVICLLAISFACVGCIKISSSPYGDVIFKVKVVDSQSGDPIKGVKVAVDDYLDVEALREAYITNELGLAVGTVRVFPLDQTATVYVTDPKGVYAKDRVEIKILVVDFSGGDGVWYEGEQIKSLTVKLKKQL